jgi:lactate dehydrogenase-like 2-hydroxyacid dehydrogenase
LNILKAEKHNKKDNTVHFYSKTMDEEEWTDSEYLFWYAPATKATKSLV